MEIALHANALHPSRGRSSYLALQVPYCDPSGNPTGRVRRTSVFRSVCPPSPCSPTTESRDVEQARAWTAVLCLDPQQSASPVPWASFRISFASLLLRHLPATVRTFVLFQVVGADPDGLTNICQSR